jgi:hypothetical protein
LLNPIILQLERDVAVKDSVEFDKHYQNLIANCNNCHATTKRPFLVIDLPHAPAYDNQHYEPVPQAVPVQAAASQPSGAAKAQ